jgi:hypothetical protein
MSLKDKCNGFIQCVSDYRDFIVSCSSLILAIIAALCSIYVYYDNQHFREDIAIYSISNQIYKIQFIKEKKKANEELLVILGQLSNARRDIRKPFGFWNSSKDWAKNWKKFESALKGGIEKGLLEYKDNIGNAWKDILKNKGLNYE